MKALIVAIALLASPVYAGASNQTCSYSNVRTGQVFDDEPCTVTYERDNGGSRAVFYIRGKMFATVVVGRNDRQGVFALATYNGIPASRIEYNRYSYEVFTHDLSISFAFRSAGYPKY